MGELILVFVAVGPPAYIDPGRWSREGDLPPGGAGDGDLGGCPVPVNFFWVKVREKMAWERED